jgi:transposase InsO family protein
VRAVITDNGVAYQAHARKNTDTAAGITVRYTHLFRPQTRGKVE